MLELETGWRERRKLKRSPWRPILFFIPLRNSHKKAWPKAESSRVDRKTYWPLRSEKALVVDAANMQHCPVY
jgi:hypothetical protein